MNSAHCWRRRAWLAIAAGTLLGGIGCDRLLPKPQSADSQPSPAPSSVPEAVHAGQQDMAGQSGQNDTGAARSGGQPPMGSAPPGPRVPPAGSTSVPSNVARQRPTAPNPGRSTPGTTKAPVTGTQPRFYVRLSTGIALPQSLPTGTTMGFSVDYAFTANLPASHGQVVWVIQTARRGAVVFPVELKASGNLSMFAPGVRPEHGPFQSFFAVMTPDGRPMPISRKIAMR